MHFSQAAIKLYPAPAVKVFFRSNFKLTPFSTEWEQLLDFGVYYRVFRYARSRGLVRNNFGLALWAKSKMATICPRSNNKLISFSTK